MSKLLRYGAIVFIGVVLSFAVLMGIIISKANPDSPDFCKSIFGEEYIKSSSPIWLLSHDDFGLPNRYSMIPNTPEYVVKADSCIVEGGGISADYGTSFIQHDGKFLYLCTLDNRSYLTKLDYTNETYIRAGIVCQCEHAKEDEMLRDMNTTDFSFWCEGIE